MDAKKIALLVGALIIAGVTAFMAKNMFAGAGAPQAAAAAPAPQQPVGPKILVATRALPVGTIIGPDSFRFQPWPKELIQNAYYVEGQNFDMNSLNGTVVRTAVTAGQPITQGAIVKPGDRGFLAAALGPGMRAVTVPVSQQSGVAGFIFPGDRVDMMLTQSVEGEDGPALRTSETIIRNARVLATDQRTVSDNEEGKKDVKVFSTVTLEVTPRIAEKIAVAQSIGQISLSLRSIADNASELERAIASGDVKVPDGTDPKAEKQMLQIMQMCEISIQFRKLVYHERILDVIEDLIGPNIQLFHDQALYKPAYHGGPVHWHQDNAYWQCAPANLVSAWLTLDDVNRDNGAMQFIPGTHLQVVGHDRATTSNTLLDSGSHADASRAVVVDLPAGGITIHHCQTLHMTAPNTTANQRRALAIHFMNPGTKSLRTNQYLPVSFGRPVLRMRV